MIRGVDCLPEPIKEEIKRAAYEELEDLTKRPINQLFITELSWCLRKAFFRRKLGENRDSLKTAWNFYKGIMLDRKWCPLFKQNQKRATYQIPQTDIVISGKLDFIYPDYERVYELKTIKNCYYLLKDEAPKEEHKMQVLFYAYCNGFSKASLIYTDYSEVVRFDFEKEDIGSILKVIEARAELLYQALLMNVPPEGKQSSDWECSECEYREACEVKYVKSEQGSSV